MQNTGSPLLLCGLVLRQGSMLKRIIPLFLLLAVLLCGCGAKPDAETTGSAAETQTAASAQAEPTPTETTAPPQTAAANPAAQNAKDSTTEKVGEMRFTDDENDKFIQAIVQKYGADPARLACIYAVPEADNNHVFEFDGTTDENGKLLRNARTLKYVYSLNRDCTVITRAGGRSGNDGLSTVQGVAIFEVTKKFVLPKFETELNA